MHSQLLCIQSHRRTLPCQVKEQSLSLLGVYQSIRARLAQTLWDSCHRARLLAFSIGRSPGSALDPSFN